MVAPTALDQRLAARIAARAAVGRNGGGKDKRRRKPQAAEAVRETRADGWVRAAHGHLCLDPTPYWTRPSRPHNSGPGGGRITQRYRRDKRGKKGKPLTVDHLLSSLDTIAMRSNLEY